MSRDLEFLQGYWRVTALEMDGQPAPVFGDASVVIKGNRFTTSGMGEVYKGTLELDDSKKPRQLDMKFTAGPEKGNSNPAIYKLKDDAWTMCIATQGPNRPRTFATKSGSGFVLETLSRGKGAVPKVAKRVAQKAAKKALPTATEFEGEWEMLSGVMNGVAMAPELVKWVRRVTEGNETTVIAGPQTMMKFQFTMDEAQAPKAMDYLNIAGPNKGKVQLAIYELKKGTLSVCVAAPGKPRPKRFQSVAGEGASFTTWKKK